MKYCFFLQFSDISTTSLFTLPVVARWESVDNIGPVKKMASIYDNKTIVNRGKVYLVKETVLG